MTLTALLLASAGSNSSHSALYYIFASVLALVFMAGAVLIWRRGKR
jgi:hypothetical protein